MTKVAAKRSRTLEKQVQAFYDECALRPNYRAERWVLSKRELALLCRYSIALMDGYDIPLSAEQERQADILSHGLNCEYITVGPTQEKQGLAWLWNQWNEGWLSASDLCMLKKFEYFTVAGVNTIRSGLHWRSTPIYRVHCVEGTFVYVGWSWQSGFKPQVTERRLGVGV